MPFTKIWLSFLLVLLLVFPAGCGGRHDTGPQNPGANGTPPEASAGDSQNSGAGTPEKPAGEGETSENPAGEGGTPAPGKPADPIAERLARMSMEEKIGQMVIVGLDGETADEHARTMLSEYRVGGFILFKRNIRDAAQTIGLINELKELNGAGSVPLFFGVDQEGGKVDRMPDEFEKFPTNAEIGKIGDQAFSRQIGRLLAKEIKSLGFNLNFAPVLDVNSNPQNPVIGDRSFGATAEIVSSLGVETMKGIQEENVVSVVKHFPGHGDTSVDSHIGLPVVNNDLQRLRKLELVPFAEAIRQHADAVMVAHILLPKIDARYPSSLSKTVITDLLRNEMKFDGVVMTDDLTMGAITEQYDIGAAAVKAIQAGSDIVLVCHDFDKETAAIEALRAAAQRGELSRERIDESVTRILRLKEKYGVGGEKVGSADVRKINAEIRSVLDTYMAKKQRAASSP